MKRLLWGALAVMLAFGGVQGAFAQSVPAAYLLYPNYRGLIFSDRPEIVVDAPSGAVVTLKDKVSGSTVATATGTGASVKLAAGSLTANHAYTVTVTNGGSSIGSWDVTPVAASTRDTMNIAADPQTAHLTMHGKPRFGLGVYDSGLSYYTDAAGYETDIFSAGGKRQLGGVNLNMYLNYHYGQAPIGAMTALMDALQNHGMMYLQTANCFNTGSYTRIAFSADSGTFAADFSKHPGAAGFYIMDECVDTLVPETTSHHKTLSGNAANTMTLAVTLAGPKIDQRLWSQSSDVLGTDPYPLYGAEPAAGYSHFQVADYVAYTKNAVHGSRPVFSVLQFFKFTSDSRWPTAAEQRSHAIMSIVEGADGLFWWELGQGGLQKDASQFATQMAILKANVNELAALESVIVSPDVPTALTGNTTKYADPKAGRIAQLQLSITNSWLYNAKTMYQNEINRINAGDYSQSPMLKDAADIRTKVKIVNGKGYVFAYNYTNKTLPVTLTWQNAPGTVTENKSGKTYPVSGNSWSDTFGPYESRIYVIGTATPPPPPPPTAPTVTFSNPAAGATVSGTATVTMAGSGGSGTGYNYKLAVDGAQVYAGTNPSFSWNTTTATNASHTLTATVTDSNGLSGTATRTVTVSNVVTPPPATNPTVTFTSPAAAATVSGTATVGMSASGGTGTGYTYKLSIDGTQVYSGTTPSYSWNTTTATNASHTLTATVTDSGGKTGTATRTVTVSNTVTPPPTTGFTSTVTSPVQNATTRTSLSIGSSTTAPWGKSKTFTVLIDGKIVATTTTTGTVNWVTKTVTAGTHTIVVKVTYGGQTATSATRTFKATN